jgi:hypothetical protein
MAHKQGDSVVLTSAEFDHLHALATAFVVDQSRIKAVMTVDSYGSPQKAAELLQRLHDETKTGR